MTGRILQWFAIVWGVALIGIGFGHILFGNGITPGGATLNATDDSQARSVGSVVLFCGIAYVWAARRSPLPVQLLQVLAVITALMATGRVISAIDVGWPSWLFTVFIPTEFIAAALTWWLAASAEDVPDRENPVVDRV